MPQIPTPGDPRTPRPAQAGPGSGAGAAAPGAPGAIAFATLAEIAAGATARVDLCRVLPPHPRAGSLVAVKRLHPHIAEDPTFAKQFFDEVWMTASLRHPNVVEVAGWGTDREGAYLAVELVQGVSLMRLMKTIFETGEAFTERMVVYLALRVCLGLAAAHSLRAPTGELLGLVHRDLTPGNVLCSFNGEVKIADFGMAKAKQRLTKTLTGMRKGEPTYMAPEQARSDDYDARADLFSLGVMLFELFSGRRPWTARSDLEMIEVVSREPPADLRDLRPKIDRELVSIVNHCLEKTPATRFQSAHEIAGRLDEWLTLHGYQEGNDEALGRFVRRNAMRQMRWFERAIAGELTAEKIGRDIPPRIPTYNDDHTEPFPDRGAVAPAAPAVPAAASRAGIEDHPTVDASRRNNAVVAAVAKLRSEIPRAGAEPVVRGRQSAPADPRSIRAAQAVQQLKKLAPPVEPPRARGRGRPSMADDADEDDPTDVALKYPGVPGLPPRGRSSHPGLPRIGHEEEEDDSEDSPGEEAPTLVQKGDAKLQALRAEARKKRDARPPVPRVGAVDDEDSDEHVTEVSREEARRAAAAAIADPESELPTSPMQTGRPPMGAGGPPRPALAQIPAAPQIPGQGKVKKADTGPRAPVHQIIPRSPDIPQRPFSPGQPARGGSGTMPAVPGPSRRAPNGPLPVLPVPREPEPAPAVTDPARTTNPDDEVVVIDRSALQQSLFGTEESIVAEADRLAIEAVRRSEEARAAHVRAERKAAAARLASEAAMIATDAVRLIRAEGLSSAARRLEEARTLDQNIQTGKIPIPDPAAASRGSPSSFPVSATPTMLSARPAVEERFPTPAALPAFPGAPPSTNTPVFTPLAYGPGAQPPGALGTPLPASSPRQDAGSPAAAPTPTARPPAQPAPTPLPAPAPAGPGQPLDGEVFRPQTLILGLPSGVVVALAIAAVIIVILLALVLAK